MMFRLQLTNAEVFGLEDEIRAHFGTMPNDAVMQEWFSEKYNTQFERDYAFHPNKVNLITENEEDAVLLRLRLPRI